ncbi:hypothetical protein jhhlp_001821 [Lomentospora prolificans]|uniref:Uncharacterized protein n=1 Tax=Lomentospora prolificans TaxID=41688 RepID=A0A2N3NGV0_9PEZI|nr:hypothetical protein jhhlp_001821 [Lomentospora prolificans]
MSIQTESDELSTPSRKSAFPAHEDAQDATTPNQKGAPDAAAAVATPKSAPAAADRQRASTKGSGPPPTLLVDFLRGRPSPARIAAQRQRRMSMDAVKAEIRQEMRQSSVQKLQQPGGVRDRVKTWQKANAAAMMAGDPMATPSEPTEIAFQDEEKSVTEEDRVRIKMRKKKRSTPKVVVEQAAESSKSSNSGETKPENASTATLRRKTPPKKRVVSDDHWMNNKKEIKKKNSPPRARKKSPEGSPMPIPKDFLLRTAQNPPASQKVREWAKKVEPVPPADGLGGSRHRPSKSADYSRSADSLLDSELSARSEKTPSTPRRSRTPAKSGYSFDDDGIRVTPIRESEKERKRNTVEKESNFSVPSTRTEPLDDGIRVRAVPELADADAEPKKSNRKTSRSTSKSAPSIVPSIAPSLSLRDKSPYDLLDEDRATETGKVTAEIVDEPDTPSRRKVSKSKPKLGQKKRTPAQTEITQTTQTSKTTDTTNKTKATDAGESTQSDLPEMAGGRSPGASSSGSGELGEQPSVIESSAPTMADIPVGKSAFSELDLPLGADARNSSKRQKPQRNPSLSAVPKVFKRVVSEGKKMMHPEPPRPVGVNKPPSIETWLTNTVDPFVDVPGNAEVPNPIQRRKSVEKKWAAENQARVTAPEEATPKKASPKPEPPPEEDEENVTPKASEKRKSVETPAIIAAKTPTSSGLKRKGATRGVSSPLKANLKKPFREALKEAFKGPSTNQIFTQTSYESREERTYRALDSEVSFEEECVDPQCQCRRRSTGSGSGRRSQSPDSFDSRDFEDDRTTSSLPEPRRRPPTKGFHELSTIVSEESSSSHGNETMSTVSQTTITQTTVTKESELSRRSSQRPGLKRRLTKHSDLVSVLSAPDDKSVPSGVKNSRSRPSIRRTRSKHSTVTTNDLLGEFADDENLYNRELKTLVDGVIPVLLNSVISESTDLGALFGPTTPGRKVDAMSKAVVGMGISLEKLRNAHRRAPLYDVDRLIPWLEGVAIIYDGYLDAWRLGFENLIVNLAPVSDIPDDQDSLLNALPRNDDGDIVNEDGERVDVAHLLRRPIYRMKMMTNFVKGIHDMIGSDQTALLVGCFESLHDKARKRHKEERARVTDEDAANTDTTRTRDLRTLAAMGYIKIDPTLQVSAKDVFNLSLYHSNGQRMNCQVELVHRDNPNIPSHPGEVLIRQTGEGQRTWLLFPPMPMGSLSARKLESGRELIVMIRGTHNGKMWRELMRLTTDDEGQIDDWVDILGTLPLPPLELEPPAPSEDNGSPRQSAPDVPLGAQRSLEDRDRGDSPNRPLSEPSTPTTPTTPTKTALPSRYHARPTPPAYQLEVTAPESPAHDEPLIPHNEHDDLTKPNAKPYRADGAPPPPIHRTFAAPQSKSSTLQPPSNGRMKRKTSSPLKHEYLPSDVSSEESGDLTSESDEESETASVSDSSGDEIDSVDIPDTEVGVSIKHDRSEITGSVISDASLTPSNSASQAGLHQGLHYRQQQHQQPVELSDTCRFVCSVSHWHDKRGLWKDLSSHMCSIVVSPGMMEAFSMKPSRNPEADKPLVALDLTPVVLVRKSNALDLEVRTAVLGHSKITSIGGGTFRFRNATQEECVNLYAAVHNARLKNEKYIQLENEMRFKSFGERRPVESDEDGGGLRKRSWFGRKNSYRASARAPTRSVEEASTAASSSMSASSFLKRLTGGANLSFNIGRSSIEKQNGGAMSFYTSGSSSAGGSGPRSPSVSIDGTGRGEPISSDNVPIRLHLLVSASKWEDCGNCRLQVRRPPEGWRQELRANHGLEKRITVTTIPKKKDGSEMPRVVLDAVLGSGCFTTMGSRGIICSVWEEMRDEFGRMGYIPNTNNPGGSVKKWCFQLGGVAQASWLLALLHEEVVRA